MERSRRRSLRIPSAEFSIPGSPTTSKVPMLSVRPSPSALCRARRSRPRWARRPPHRQQSHRRGGCDRRQAGDHHAGQPPTREQMTRLLDLMNPRSSPRQDPRAPFCRHPPGGPLPESTSALLGCGCPLTKAGINTAWSFVIALPLIAVWADGHRRLRPDRCDLRPPAVAPVPRAPALALPLAPFVAGREREPAPV